MSRTHPRQKTSLRVRIDECDGTGSITPGRIFSLCDETRFDLYDLLSSQGVHVPMKHVAKAEQLVIDRHPKKREALTIEAWIEAVGRTSYRVGHRIVGEDATEIARLSSTLVVIVGEEEAEQSLASLRGCAHDPLGLPADDPELPEGGVAFLRTIDAWPSDENTGRHVARTRMIDWMNDARRIGVWRSAFEHVHAMDAGPLASVSIVYERESFTGDALRLAIAASAAGVFDAKLVRGGDLVARARLRV